MGFCMRNYLAPHYSEAVQEVVLEHVASSGQDPSCARGAIPMDELLGEVIDVLRDKAFCEDDFCDGFWKSFLSDIVSNSENLDELREILVAVNSYFTDDDRNREAVLGD